MKRILLLLFTCFVFAQCKKEKNTPSPDNPYGLPNATQTGDDIFACRVNGENWISKTDLYNLRGRVENDSMSIAGGGAINIYFDVLIFHIKGGILQGKTYLLDEPNLRYGFLMTNQTCQGLLGANYLTRYTSSGNLTISKLDRDARILSGTFSCKIPIPNCDTLNITDGRFDIKYY